MPSFLEVSSYQHTERLRPAIVQHSLAMPPQDTLLNQMIIEAVGHVETHRLQLASLALNHVFLELYKRYYIAEFIDALNEYTAFERGCLLWSYNLSNATVCMERCLAYDKSCYPDSSDLFGLSAFANAYTFMSFQKGVEATRLPLFFDEAAIVRFPRHSRYIQGGPEYRYAYATAILCNGIVKIDCLGKSTISLPLDSLMDLQKAVPKEIFGDWGVGERKCIPSTSIQVCNKEATLRQALESSHKTINEAIIKGGGPTPNEKLTFENTEDPEVIRILGDAVQGIKDVWSEAYTDLLSFSQVVVPFGVVGAGLVGSSNENLAGVSILRIRPSSIPALAANLLHENAHKRFMALTRISPFLKNDVIERVSSPWRRDPRPVRGVLYGLHAFTIVAKFYHYAISSGLPWAESLEPKFHKELKLLLQGRDTIYRYGKLTPFGEHFFQGLDEAINSLQMNC